MEGGIDCLVEVTARFLKAGEKTSENLEDCFSFTSYGPWLDDKGGEYWELRPPKVQEEINRSVLTCFDVESDEHYVILKDFIAFNFSTIFFGDFGDTGTSSRRGSGVYFDEEGLDEHFIGYEEALVADALEEKAKWDADRKRINSIPTLTQNPMSEDTNVVKFILALDYRVEETGSWDCVEYESSVEIVGKVDMSRIKEIIR